LRLNEAKHYASFKKIDCSRIGGGVVVVVTVSAVCCSPLTAGAVGAYWVEVGGSSVVVTTVVDVVVMIAVVVGAAVEVGVGLHLKEKQNEINMKNLYNYVVVDKVGRVVV
jgi:hypothetical protein